MHRSSVLLPIHDDNCDEPSSWMPSSQTQKHGSVSEHQLHNQIGSLPHLNSSATSAALGSGTVNPPPLLPFGSWWQLPSTSTEKLVHFQDEQTHPVSPDQPSRGSWWQLPSLSATDLTQHPEDPSAAPDSTDVPSQQEPWWNMYPPWWLPPPWWLQPPSAQPMDFTDLPNHQQQGLDSVGHEQNIHSSQSAFDNQPMQYQYPPHVQEEWGNYYPQQPVTNGQYGWWSAAGSPWQSEAAIHEQPKEHAQMLNHPPLQPTADAQSAQIIDREHPPVAMDRAEEV